LNYAKSLDYSNFDRIILESKNPFKDTVVRDPWETIVDVRSLNSEISDEIINTLTEIRNDPEKRSVIVLVLGAPGIGKTHVLARIRRLRHEYDFYFSYVEPPANIESIYSHIFRSIIRSLKMNGDLEKIVWTIIKKATMKNFPGSVDLGGFIKKYGFNRLLSQINYYLWEKSDLGGLLEPSLITVLLKLYGGNMYEKQLAMRWLTGDEFDERELSDLGIKKHLKDEQTAINSIKTLALLSGKPLCLCFDQCEAIYHRFGTEGLSSFLSHLMELYNWTSNLCIVVMMQRRVWNTLEENGFIDEAFAQRIGKVLSFRRMTDEEAIELVKSRLHEYLWRGRLKIDLPYDTYPITVEAIKYLNKEVKGNPRALLKALESHFNKYKKTSSVYEIDVETIIHGEPARENIIKILQDNIEKIKSEFKKTWDPGLFGDRVIKGIYDFFQITKSYNIELNNVRISYLSAGKKITKTKKPLGIYMKAVVEGQEYKVGVDVNWKGGNSLSTNISRLLDWIQMKQLDKGIIIRIGPIPKKILNSLPSIRDKVSIIKLRNNEIIEFAALSKLMEKIYSGEVTDRKGVPLKIDRVIANWIIDKYRKYESIQYAMDTLSQIGFIPQRKIVTGEILNEKQIENILYEHPEILENNLAIIERQYKVGNNYIDLLGHDDEGNTVIIEVKIHADETVIDQIKEYIVALSRDQRIPRDKIRAIIACETAKPELKRLARNQGYKVIDKITHRIKSHKLN